MAKNAYQGHEILTAIAQEHCRVPTLETRNSDSYDFHEVSVWGLKAALEAAYKAGQNSAKKAPNKMKNTQPNP